MEPLDALPCDHSSHDQILSQVSFDKQFCIPIALLQEPSNVQLEVGGKNTYWPNGTILKIGFIGGTSTQRNYVRNILDKSMPTSWLYYANLSVIYPTSGPYDIRISFVAGGGSWSYIGTDCLFVGQQYATMNIGWGPTSDVVLHEFGHAIGQLHEQQNPDHALCFNKEVVYTELGGSPNFWSRQMVDNNVLNPYPVSTVFTSTFDPISIMEYVLPGNWMCDGQSITGGKKLSQGDIDFIKIRYPIPGVPPPPPPPPIGGITLTPTQVADIMNSLNIAKTSLDDNVVKTLQFHNKLKGYLGQT